MAWAGGLPLWALATRTFTLELALFDHPWLWLLVVHGAATATFLGLSAALYRAAEAAALDDDDLYLGWPTVAIGLRFYGNGLAWRISVTFVGMFLMFMAAVSGSRGLATLFGFCLPLALIITSLVMAAGLAGYARQPAGSGGTAPAWIAFAALLLGICFDLVAFILVIRVIGGTRADVLDGSYKGLSVKLWRWGLLTGAVSLGTLLLSFGLVAAHLRRVDMVRRWSLVGSYLLTVGVVVGFLVYGPAVEDIGSALAFAARPARRGADPRRSPTCAWCAAWRSRSRRRRAVCRARVVDSERATRGRRCPRAACG